jgi:hypothetical protein
MEENPHTISILKDKGSKETSMEAKL